MDLANPRWTEPASALYRFLLTIAPQAPLDLPDFSGSMLRGVFGHALLRNSCRCGHTEQHLPDCSYAHVFEGAIQDQQRSSPSTTPAPRFVITPPPAGTIKDGETFEFEITLFDLNKYQLAEVKAAWYAACRRGLGSPPVRCTLLEMEEISCPSPALRDEITLNLKTPWLIKRKGRPLRAHACRPEDILLAINRRQLLLNQHYNLQLPTTDNQTLLDLAANLTYRAELQYVTWQRYSARQGKEHQLSGLLGQIHLQHTDAEGLTPISTLLATGTLLHAGGKTAFGLGAYDLKFHTP
ncbi:MAG: CRISPR system precrRNA processing endoribonuclease RAMP protein Cas6 [Amphritea sp.]